MTMQFSRIGLMGKPNNPEVKSTFHKLIRSLRDFKLNLQIEEACAPLASHLKVQTASAEDLAKESDLIIVVGGDGSLLNAARMVVNNNVPVIGVNRGRKGFLTDITPQALTEELIPILNGEYFEEERFLLQANIYRDNHKVMEYIALNDVVLYSGHVARMIEFEVNIDKSFVYRQRSDGLIISTPTGSTAYALSGGGPIIHPTLNAMVLVPMHPHTLSSRPIVVDANSKLFIHLTKENELNPRLSWDGQVHADLNPNDAIVLEQYDKKLRLLHPKSYDFYETLRGKLGWHIYQ
ncbi:MAG TPA: NAD(+) kinase [Gammaproteobacteria bacterium]|nr:NAD(+) kinase [Gammaproteobacteria bacterium]